MSTTVTESFPWRALTSKQYQVVAVTRSGLQMVVAEFHNYQRAHDFLDECDEQSILRNRKTQYFVWDRVSESVTLWSQFQSVMLDMIAEQESI